MTTFRTVAQPLLVALVLAAGVRSAMRIYSIPTASMTPTLQVGDHIVVTTYHHAAPDRGDVVVFHSPVKSDELLVKRVVAVPGDLVESHAGRLFVSGHAASEPYVAASSATGVIAPQIVPSGCLFVLGDNRSNSFDSRQWGILPQTMLVGRVRLVLFPSSTLHLDRLFKTIR